MEKQRKETYTVYIQNNTILDLASSCFTVKINVNSTQSCSLLYQSLLLQKVVGFLSFFAVLVLQLLQPEDINTSEQSRFERADAPPKRKHYFGFRTSAAELLKQHAIYCAQCCRLV